MACIVHPLYRDELHFEQRFTCSLTASAPGLSCLGAVRLAFAYTIWFPLCPRPVCLVCACLRERCLCSWNVLFLFLLAIIFVSLQVVAVASFFFIMSARVKDTLCTELVDRRMRVEGAGHRCWLIILFNELKSEHCVKCTYI